MTRVIGLVVLVYGYLGILLLGSLALALGCLALMFAVPNALTIKLGIVGLIAFGGFFFAIAQGLWRAILAGEGEIGSAAVARKEVIHFPQTPCYVIALKLRQSYWRLPGSTSDQQLVNRITNRIQLPGNFLVFVATDNLKALGNKIFAVPGAVVYERPEE